MEIKTIIVSMVETNCYIAFNKETNEAAIVDPGDNAERIIETSERMGAHVKAILLTHGHFDHMMAVSDLKKKWDVPVYASEKEAMVLADEALNLSGQFKGRGVSLKADVLLKNREIFQLIGYSFEHILTPGHTCGSCCYYVAKEKVLFSGDTLFAGSYGRVDFPTGSSSDMLHSVADVLLTLPEDVTVYPGHMGETTIGEERRYNPLARFGGKDL